MSGSSKDPGSPVLNFEMTIGATTEPNTLRIRPSEPLGSGTTTFRVEGNMAHAEMTGMTAEGAGIAVTLACPLQAAP